jgi:hypothetical protein
MPKTVNFTCKKLQKLVGSSYESTDPSELSNYLLGLCFCADRQSLS